MAPNDDAARGPRGKWRWDDATGALIAFTAEDYAQEAARREMERAAQWAATARQTELQKKLRQRSGAGDGTVKG